MASDTEHRDQPSRDSNAAGVPAGLLAFQPVLEAWRRDGETPAAALAWTRHQVRAFQDLVNQDAGWRRLVEIFQLGRAVDPWLASDWPHGFDELLLCAPLCQMVRFECARCDLGARQRSMSCAHSATVFGRIGALLERGDREGLLLHLGHVEAMLQPGSRLEWDPESCRPVAT